MMRILLLGGTGDALRVARRLSAEHFYSLAGVGTLPVGLQCQLRVGGFGGAEGQAAFVAEQGITLVIDATHPYAAQISSHAAQAAARAGVPCWALRRAAWQPTAADNWIDYDGWASLMAALEPYQRPLFTLGREPLAHLDEIPKHQHWTIRCLQPQPPSTRAEIIGDRGPFELNAERELFRRRQTDVLVSKNSGGASTEPKLQVAREQGLPVLMLKRPALPSVDRQFDDVAALIEALHGLGACLAASP